MHATHTRSMRSARRSASGLSAGFTLMEMVVAAMLLAISIAAAAMAIARSTQATTIAEETHMAALLAQRRLSQIELDQNALSAREEDGDFGADYPGCRYHENIEATDFPYLFRVTVTVLVSGRRLVFSTYLRNSQQEQADAAKDRPATDDSANAAGGTGGQ